MLSPKFLEGQEIRWHSCPPICCSLDASKRHLWKVGRGVVCCFRRWILETPRMAGLKVVFGAWNKNIGRVDLLHALFSLLLYFLLQFFFVCAQWMTNFSALEEGEGETEFGKDEMGALTIYTNQIFMLLFLKCSVEFSAFQKTILLPMRGYGWLMSLLEKAPWDNESGCFSRDPWWAVL